MKVLLITPPFTQLNSPYASLPFLKGTLDANSIKSDILDLSIETASVLFSRNGLEILVKELEKLNYKDADIELFLKNKDRYLNTIENVMAHLRENSFVHEKDILSGNYLPEGRILSAKIPREIEPVDDRTYSRYLASLYIDDIFVIYKKLSDGYELSKYQEKLALSPPEFKFIKEFIEKENDIITETMQSVLDAMDLSGYDLLGITVPFPGNLVGGLKTAKYFKERYPETKIVLGGGYINTELRDLTDAGIFEYTDFITLDDGELPLLSIIDFLENNSDYKNLVRTYMLQNGKVEFYNHSGKDDLWGSELGIPSYEGIDQNKYITVTETLNPMQRLWSEKGMNKLRLAHGCYWHKCKFCDTSLDYIHRFRLMPLNILIEQIRDAVEKTGVRRFHFVDEAIHPKIAVKLSIELLKNGIDIEWWGNIRLDKKFTEDVCKLMKNAGCVAVVAGLESGSKKTLKQMNKGIDLDPAVRTCYNFASNDILVHTYMIYGFPGESDLELMNSLEILRQMFVTGIVDSAYWHRFSLTSHSEVYKNKEKYNIKVLNDGTNPFANNDLKYIDLSKNDPDRFSMGLKKAVYNFMHNNMFKDNITSWFEFKAPNPVVKKRAVEDFIKNAEIRITPDMRFIWIGDSYDLVNNILTLNGSSGQVSLEIPETIANWLLDLLKKSDIRNDDISFTLKNAVELFPDNSKFTFEDIFNNELWDDLFNSGLILI